jgi:hypothetical protein
MQELEKSPGKPSGSIVETGSERTLIDISNPGKLADIEAQKAAASAGGLHQGERSDAPGEGSDGDPDKKPV